MMCAGAESGSFAALPQNDAAKTLLPVSSAQLDSAKTKNTNDHHEWNTIRRILRTHRLVSTRLPLEGGRIRKASYPDAEQARIHNALGID